MLEVTKIAGGYKADFRRPDCCKGDVLRSIPVAYAGFGARERVLPVGDKVGCPQGSQPGWFTLMV